MTKYTQEQILFDDLFAVLQFQERQRKSRTQLETLAESIRTNGLLHLPVIFRDEKGAVVIVAGAGRIEALNMLRNDPTFDGSQFFPLITVSVSDHPLSPDELTIAEYEENTAREDLKPADMLLAKRDVVLAYERLYGVKKSTAKDASGISRAMIAKKLNMSPAALSQDLTLANFVLATGDRTKDALTVSEIAQALSALQKRASLIEANAKHEEVMKGLTQDDVRKLKADAYVTGSFFDLVTGVGSGTKDFVELDSPYGIGLLEITNTVTTHSTTYEEWKPEEYEKNLPIMLNEAYRVLKPDRYAIFWLAINRWYNQAMEAARAAGFSVDTMPGFWIKDRGRSNSPNQRLTNVIESFLVLHKGDPKLAKPGTNNVFFEKLDSNKRHRTQKSVSLYEKILGTFCLPAYDILVGFAGSGNALLAAFNIKCSPIGFDIIKENRHQYVNFVMNGESEDTKQEEDENETITE